MTVIATLVGILIWLIILALVLCIIWLPVTISKKRNLDNEQRTGILCCTLLGILFFPLWIIGMILACVLKPQTKDKVVKEEKSDDSDLERLEKLHTLYKNKVITKAEYDKQRKKIMA